jgi:hypothetical protein
MVKRFSPAYFTIVAASFLTSDYFLYRQRFQNVHSRVWVYVLGDNVGAADQPGDRQ